MQEESEKKVKRSDERKGSVRKNIRFEDNLIEAISEQLPDNPDPNTKDKIPKLGFSEWVKDACWKKLGK
ncbi:DUF3950 domain-containing protein [Alteromonas sp. M12]|uniref:DUF3950 domain-containing protein n=1 Tax=Alteromonas sp. M12 TaxID=3135644 RepID=UPI00319E5349